MNEAEYARQRLAEDAREAARYEREAARAARAAAARVEAARKAAAVIIRELPEQAASMAAAAGESEQLDYARQLAEAAAVLGVSEAEAAETVSAARDYMETPKAARPGVSKAGYGSALTPAELAAVREWSAAGLATPAAVAGRAALDAIGPRAAGLVLTNRAADTLTIARSVRVPSASVAGRRAEESAAELAEATAKLTAAELAVTAARKRKAKRPIDAAEADANRLAAAVDKLAARADLAARLAAAADDLEALNLSDLEAFMSDAVEVLALDKAAEAAGVSLRKRADLMPASFRHSGPSVKAARLVSGRGHLTMAAGGSHADPTGDSAAELAAGYRGRLAAAEAYAVEFMAAAAEADKAERAEAREARRVEYKAREAARKRTARRAAKIRNR